MKQTLLILILFFLFSCTSSFDKAAWRIAEQSVTNSKEQIRFLEHYKGQADEEKYKAACFLFKKHYKMLCSDLKNQVAEVYKVDLKQKVVITKLEF